MAEKNNIPRIQNLSRRPRASKSDVSTEVIVEKLSELSEQVRDVKKNVEFIESLSVNSDKTLAVQAQQLAEHMRRTDALEQLVTINKEQLDNKDEKIFEEQKELLQKVTEVGTEVSKIKTFVIWGAGTVGFIITVVQFILKMAG